MRTIDKRRLHETKNGTLSKQVETFSGRCSLGQSSQNTRRRTTILADTVECYCCIQFCTTRMHLHGDFSNYEFYSRHSRRLDFHQKLYSKVLGKRSSSNSSRARHFWECISSQLETVCGHFGEGRDEKYSRQLNRGVRNPSQQETVAE